MLTAKTDKKDLLRSKNVNDASLVELAGFHAYREVNEDDKIIINEEEFKVMHVIKDTETGLDAFTVRDTHTKDYTIVYVGTDTKSVPDIKTDVKLLSSIPPAQLDKGLWYFNEMEKEYGPISSITGNSLGGGVANYVAVKRPKVKAVTLNPALLPSGVVSRNANYGNITNYMSQYDVLTRGLKALGYDGRIPGRHFEINNGIPNAKMFKTNHTGYLKDDINRQYYEIGEKGQPGFGKIYIDAGSHVMTSIWTGIPLYYGNSEPVNINVESLKTLAIGIQDEIHSRVDRAHEYLRNSLEIVNHEGNQYTKRINKLQDIFKLMIEGEVGNTLFKGITVSSSLIKMEIDYMIAQTYIVEKRCESLNLILNSPPSQLLEFITKTNVDVAIIFETVRRQLRDFKDIVDDVSVALDRIMRRELVEIFKGGTEMWLDAVVREMQAHFNILDANKGLFEEHINQYQTQVYETAETFDRNDDRLAIAIQGKRAPDMSVITGQVNNVYRLKESPYLVLTLRMKETQVATGYVTLQGVANTLVKPILQLLHGILAAVELSLETAVNSIRGTLSIGFNWTLPGILISQFTNFDDQVRNKVNNALQPIDELLELVESLRIGVNRLDSRLLPVIHSLKPYIDSALFDKSAFHNVHLYNTATVSLFEDMDLLFEDIVSQLSNHQAKSITSLQVLSQQVKDNISLLKEQTVRGTI